MESREGGQHRVGGPYAEYGVWERSVVLGTRQRSLRSDQQECGKCVVWK